MMNRRTLLAGGAALALAPAARAQTPAAPLPVLASFSILADLVAQIGGERVSVSALVGPGGDAHVFQPSPSDARRVATARLVVRNGLHFDDWAQKLVDAAATKPPVIVAAEGVKPLEAPQEGHGGHSHDGHDEADRLDPHAWQSVANAKLYCERIRQGLSAVDPAGAPAYAARAENYARELEALDAEIRAAVAAIPPERRVVVTTHDAFGYFAAAYGLKFVAPKGISSDAEASPKDVARIIRQIKAEKIPAVFLENISDPRQMQRIAAETGAKIGGTLYSDSLSPPDGPAPTYIAMMRHNIRELSKALAA